MPSEEPSDFARQVAELSDRRRRAERMGGEEQVRRQHSRGKLTARERIDLLFDPGTFQEFGMLAHQQAIRGGEADPAQTPADGVVTGSGLIDGRPVHAGAYDFTVMAGSIGMVGEMKMSRLREMAMRRRTPIVWLLDSAGARIQEAAGSAFAGTGQLFYEQVQMSGVIPQVAAMMGPCSAGTAYIPGLADFVPMVKGTSSMSLAGARLVRAATGEETTDHEMGGSQIHCQVSGVGDLEVEDDAACIAVTRDFLSYLPSDNSVTAPLLAPEDDPDRLIPDFERLVPTGPRQGYDMRRVVARIVDGGRCLEIKPGWARNILTMLARIGGQSVGIVASQPQVKAGALDNDASDKAARFIRMCDAFNVPLLFLQDVPGFIVGPEVERQGIIRHGAKMLYAVSEATVPKITVIIRKAYGAGYYVMCGRGYQPDLIVAWPGAEISVMGPEGAVNIIFNKQIEAADDPATTRAALVDNLRGQISPYISAGWSYIDDVIDPAETRRVIHQTLVRTRGKRLERAWRKHGNMPV